MYRYFFTILMLFLLVNAAEAQEKVYINHTGMTSSFAHNIDTHLSDIDAFSIIVGDKLFQQPVFAELRHENFYFVDQFGNEYNAGYLSLGVGPRFSLFKYFTYDAGFYIGVLIHSRTKMIREDFPTRTLTEGKIMAIQRLTYGINIFSDVSLNIHGEIHHHFNNLVEDFIWGRSGQPGYEVSYNVGIGFSYQFGK